MTKSRRRFSQVVLLSLVAVAVVWSLVTQTQADPVVPVDTLMTDNWQAKLKATLPTFGHRNWIVIADSAYPQQSAPGIETIYTGASQLELLEIVLEELKAAKHVRPIALLDAELKSVPEENAPGVEAYRQQLKQKLANTEVKSLAHEQIIAKLDETSKMFNVLLLKSDMTIPYTSVFLQLECGYWGAAEEAELREILKGQ